MSVIIRKAVPEDAEKMVAYIRELTAEPDIDLVTGPGEFKLTPAEEAEFIATQNAAPNGLILVAEDGEEMVGLLSCRGDTRQARLHATILGITVAKSYRGKGIGRRLMQEAIDWGRESSTVRRIELIVIARNQRAIDLYTSLGFQTEGRFINAICKDGEYLDNIAMALHF